MGDDVENHTIRLLQEMRGEITAGFAAVNARLDEFDNRLAGQNLLLSMIAGLVAKQEERLDRLEHRSA